MAKTKKDVKNSTKSSSSNVSRQKKVSRRENAMDRRETKSSSKNSKKQYTPTRDKNFTGIDKTIVKDKVYWARYKKGKLVEKTPAKDLTKEDALKNYKDNNTIIPNRNIVNLRNFDQVTSFITDGKNPRRPGTKSYQAVVEIRLKVKGGRPIPPITARSQTHPPNYPTEKALEEAWESAYERVSQTFGGAYKSSVGQDILSQYDYTVKEGIVWYRKV